MSWGSVEDKRCSLWKWAKIAAFLAKANLCSSLRLVVKRIMIHRVESCWCWAATTMKPANANALVERYCGTTLQQIALHLKPLHDISIHSSKMNLYFRGFGASEHVETCRIRRLSTIQKVDTSFLLWYGEYFGLFPSTRLGTKFVERNRWHTKKSSIKYRYTNTFRLLCKN